MLPSPRRRASLFVMVALLLWLILLVLCWPLALLALLLWPLAWLLSQFLHGEQGALLATAQLVSAVPIIDAKLYAATQVIDEARHVEVYERYVCEKLENLYPINPHLKTLLDQILADARWDMKYLGMQILVEGLALAALDHARHEEQEDQGAEAD